MSDTPRTDDQCDHPHNICLDNDRGERLGKPPLLQVVPADFARELERELAQMHSNWDSLEKQLLDCRHQLSTTLKERNEAEAVSQAYYNQIQDLAKDRDNWRRIVEKLCKFAVHDGNCNRHINMHCTCGLTALYAELKTLKTKGK